MNRGDNYKVAAANEQAEATIKEINQTDRLIFVDWAREILPRSLGDDRLKSNDQNPYHYGLTPRLIFLQMISHVIDTQIQQKKNHLQQRQQQDHAQENSTLESLSNGPNNRETISTIRCPTTTSASHLENDSTRRAFETVQIVVGCVGLLFPVVYYLQRKELQKAMQKQAKLCLI
jgi:hypothetical protein